MGSGKSTVGRLLSNALNVNFLDSDRELEKKLNSSISKLFETEGEAYFRSAETQFLKQEVSQMPPAIIATGGGMPCFNNNIDLLKASGKVIWLDTPTEELVVRLKNNWEKRPLLKDKSEILEEYIEQLKAAREQYYAQANFTLKTADCSKHAIVQKIIDFLD